MRRPRENVVHPQRNCPRFVGPSSLIAVEGAANIKRRGDNNERRYALNGLNLFRRSIARKGRRGKSHIVPIQIKDPLRRLNLVQRFSGH